LERIDNGKYLDNNNSQVTTRYSKGISDLAPKVAR